MIGGFIYVKGCLLEEELKLFCVGVERIIGVNEQNLQEKRFWYLIIELCICVVYFFIDDICLFFFYKQRLFSYVLGVLLKEFFR